MLAAAPPGTGKRAAVVTAPGGSMRSHEDLNCSVPVHTCESKYVCNSWACSVAHGRLGLVHAAASAEGEPAGPTAVLPPNAALQPWHVDDADLVSLLCLKRAKEGGLRCVAHAIP